MKHLYRPLLRPAGYATLPKGLQWSYVEAPWDLADRLTDLPRCSTRHGLIATERPLTDAECETFDLQPEVTDRLSEAFERYLKTNMDHGEYAAAVAANAVEANPNICHTHDYLDANACMEAAFEDVYGRASIAASDQDTAVMNAAWDRWRDRTRNAVTR